MNVFALVRWLAGFFLAELVQHAIAIAVSLVIFLPVVFLVTWLALPRLLHGPDALVWLVTGIFVAIALPLVWFIHRLTSRVDKAFFARDDVYPTTEIHEFARSGDLANLEIALRSTTALERRNEQGYTPLMVAITSSQAGVDVVRCLIEHGADVNAVSTPLPPLAKEVAAMKQAGLDTSFLDRANQSPAGISALALAVEHASLADVELLVKGGADVTWIDDEGYSVLLKALFSGVDTADDQRRAILECLIAAGSPLDCVSDYGESVLTVAARAPDVELVRFFLDRGADPSVLRWSEVFRTIAFGNPEDLSVLLSNNPSLEEVDCWERTPFLFAVHCGKLEMAKQLLEQGCNRFATGRVGSTAVAYAIEGNQPQVLQWLLANGWDVPQPVDQFTASALRHAVQYDRPECVRRLIEAGAEIYEENEYGFDLMHEATSPEVIWFLHQAGIELDGLPSEQRARLLPANDGQPFEVTAADYQAFHAPRFGQSNPDEMGNPFWNEMVRSRCSAYMANEEFGEGKREWSGDQKVWCFGRFGHSLTRLPSGQLVEIGGEHEDSYDPDFCIYNDVVVHDGHGRFHIFGYPREVFPPTDFHSATFLDGCIYIIGSLGYPDDRQPGQTPVFRLNCETWSIQAVPSGGQVPGWIHGHKARVQDDGTILIWGGKVWDGEDLVGNPQAFRFDTRTGHWNVAVAP
jgi:ankyrin repeat protein